MVISNSLTVNPIQTSGDVCQSGMFTGSFGGRKAIHIDASYVNKESINAGGPSLAKDLVNLVFTIIKFIVMAALVVTAASLLLPAGTISGALSATGSFLTSPQVLGVAALAAALCIYKAL